MTRSKTKKTKKNTKKFDAKDSVTMPCLICGTMVTRYLHPDALRGYRMYCTECAPLRHTSQRIDHNTSDSHVHSLARRAYEEAGLSSPVKVYRPGDPDFDRIAAQCSPLPETPAKQVPYYRPVNYATPFLSAK